jgi:hypothetical protein
VREERRESSSSIFLISNRCFHMGHKHGGERGTNGVGPFEYPKVGLDPKGKESVIQYSNIYIH